MTDKVDDLLAGLFGSRGARTSRSNDTTRNRSANRQECAQEGHRYRVHGKTNPNKVECGRCEVTWAIGPRTELTT